MPRVPPTLSPLQHDWSTVRNASNGWPQFLESVQVSGLRGWSGERVEFRFPVTAIAGENGAGKSTILKASAAAYTTSQQDGLTFYPDDFFPNTPWETVDGVVLEYQIRRGNAVNTITLRKPSKRWRGLPDRYPRAVFYLDISRTQPINTLVGYGKIAKELNFPGQVTPFSEDDRALLSRIMNRAYVDSGMARHAGKQVGILTTATGAYSNFHQGAGEDATADLVALIRTAPNNSLVIIDEVEASLHPRAQRRLMTELFDISRKRRIQFILSTHSHVILEQLPTEARVYIQGQRTGPRGIIYGITPEFAMSLMDDRDHPELFLYCEDNEASVMVDSLIRHEAPEISGRISVVPVGAASSVAMLGDIANAGNLPAKSLGVLDADQPSHVGCIKLPGSLAPEKEAFQGLDEAAWEKVALRLDVRVADLLDAVDDAQQIANHHAWVRRVAERLGPRIRVTRVWEDITAVWAKDVVDSGVRSSFVESVKQELNS
jgi:predicted ATPase